MLFNIAIFVSLALGQLLQPQTDTWNSTFSLSQSQIDAANISTTTANNINIAVRFERSNWATGSVYSDPFYTALPANSSGSAPGTLLKVEPFVNTSFYTLAPTLALSRIIYVSETLNNSPVPASAYVLWPYAPRHLRTDTSYGNNNNNNNNSSSSKIPLVAFAHGASGIFAECGPSHIRNLWYAYSAPFTLALAGYAVVAPDYAGLGVPKDAQGKEIVNQVLASPAASNDLVNAVLAARSAFDELSEEFVVVGHSQGGGAAWGVAEREVKRPTKGYLGTIAGSPATNLTRQVEVLGPSAIVGLLTVARSVVSVFPDVLSIGDILTAQGQRLLNLMEAVQGCNSAFLNLILGLVSEGDPSKLNIANPTFLTSIWWKKWNDLATVGFGHNFKGPLLVLQGTADPTVPEQVTTEAVNKTCSSVKSADLEYVRMEGIGHVPIMYAAQRLWLDWIADRFEGKPTVKRCNSYIYAASMAPRPVEQYEGDLNYFLEYATAPYQTA
jgi:pimeloyl-ACP methyl ester carboxylesterase